MIDDDKRDRWSEETIGLCPTCLRSVPARLFEDNGRIRMEGICPRHGASHALIASDSAEYLRLRQYVPARTSSGCCGSGECCAPGEPPVCVLLVEITRACNLRCPTCYADAQGHDFVPIDAVRRRLDQFFRRQRSLDVLMISGGEPTIHPEFLAIVDAVLAYPVQRVLINTNGLRLATDDALVAALSERSRRVELYFSFASFRPVVHQRLYGRDLTREKRRALERVRDAGIFVTLVPTVESGVNVDEIGDLYRFALEMDNINGLTYQPVMNAGRYIHEYDPDQRLTLTDTIRELERQTGGDLRSSDFVGLPCSHPDCCALTYGFLDAGRKVITPLPRYLDVGRYLALFSDRISFSGMLGSAARRVWSDLASLRGRQTLQDLALLFSQAGVRDMAPLIRDPETFGRRVMRIVVKPFMDAHTYDRKRIDQCCTKILDEQGEAVSFCEYNILRRGAARGEEILQLTARGTR